MSASADDELRDRGRANRHRDSDRLVVVVEGGDQCGLVEAFEAQHAAGLRCVVRVVKPNIGLVAAENAEVDDLAGIERVEAEAEAEADLVVGLLVSREDHPHRGGLGGRQQEAAGLGHHVCVGGRSNECAEGKHRYDHGEELAHDGPPGS